MIQIHVLHVGLTSTIVDPAGLSCCCHAIKSAIDKQTAITKPPKHDTQDPSPWPYLRVPRLPSMANCWRKRCCCCGKRLALLAAAAAQEPDHRMALDSTPQSDALLVCERPWEEDRLPCRMKLDEPSAAAMIPGVRKRDE